MENAQTLINRLAAQVANQRRARERGDAKVIASYVEPINETLTALEVLGYDREECLAACGE